MDSRIGTLPRCLSYLVEKFASRDGVDDAAVGSGGQVPCPAIDRCLHELVAESYRVVCILVLQRDRVGAIEVHIEAGFLEDSGLLFLTRLAPDELLDVRMVDIENHHLRGTPGCSTALYGSR